MKLGMCSYNFVGLLSSGRLTVEEMFRMLRDWGCDHIEISDFTLPVYEGDMPKRLKEYSEAYGIEIAGLNFGSDIAHYQGDEYERELEKLRKKLDVANEIGATGSRIDLARISGQGYRADGRLIGGTEDFDDVFEGIVRAARDLCDYNAQYGKPVTSENHGIMFNGADRMRRIWHAVDRPNYGITLDAGNSLCVGEDPLVLVEELLPIARRIHLKDFYVRGKEEGLAIGAEDLYGNALDEPGVMGHTGWLVTRYGDYLRGAIVGQGDIPMEAVVQKIVTSDYDGRGGEDGHISIEFEGIEDPILGSKIGLRSLRGMMEMAKG